MQQSPCSPTTCCGTLVPPEWPVALARLSEKSWVCRLLSPQLNAPKSAVLLPDSTGAPHEEVSPRQCGKHTILLTRVLASPRLGCRCPFQPHSPRHQRTLPCHPQSCHLGSGHVRNSPCLSTPPRGEQSHASNWFSIQSTKGRLL